MDSVTAEKEDSLLELSSDRVFLPLATSTPRHRRDAYDDHIDYSDLANDPSMPIDQTFLQESSDELSKEYYPEPSNLSFTDDMIIEGTFTGALYSIPT
jgi:hypothetical protein